MMNFIITARSDEAAARLYVFCAKNEGLSVIDSEYVKPGAPGTESRPTPKPPRRPKRRKTRKCAICGDLFTPQGLGNHEKHCRDQVL